MNQRHEKHANIMGVRECYQTNRAHLQISKTWWSSPPNLPWKWCIQKWFSLSLERIHLKAPILSRDARAHTYIKYNRGGLWYPYPFGSMGFSTFPNPNKLIWKFCNMYSIITNFAKWPVRSQCVQVYTWAYMVSCVWSWEACVYHDRCACICGVCFFLNLDSNLLCFIAH